MVLVHLVISIKMLTNRINGIIKDPITVENARPAAAVQPISMVVRLIFDISTSVLATGLIYVHKRFNIIFIPIRPIPTDIPAQIAFTGFNLTISPTSVIIIGIIT